MKILSVRRGFASDHSSTSYEFLAVDKSLDKKERAEVSKLSRRVVPTKRRANFTYHVDGYDIPGGWEKLMEQYYDVMYLESYDWWTLAIAFTANPGQYDKLLAYDFSGMDDLGVGVLKKDKRIIVTIHCRIELGMSYQDQYGYYDEDDYEDEYEVDNDDVENGMVETDDELLNLLVQIRKQIMDGDYRSLYAVWEKYGYESDETPPPKPKDRKTGEDIVNDFKNMLAKL
jgi:hypothetical protein